MSVSIEVYEKSLSLSHILMSKLHQGEELRKVFAEAVENVVQLSGSHYALLIHISADELISDFVVVNSNVPLDHKYLEKNLVEIRSCLLPLLRRSSPLIANNPAAIKSALNTSAAWRLMHRTVILPLICSYGDKKGLLALFGKPSDYQKHTVTELEPLTSFIINLLVLDEQKTLEQRVLFDHRLPKDDADPKKQPDYQFAYSSIPRFITTADGIIVNCNAVAESLMALPSETLVGQSVLNLIPKLKLNLHKTSPDDEQTLIAISKSGKTLQVRVSSVPFIEGSELLFSIQLRDIQANTEGRDDRKEQNLRVQKQQSITLEVARIATQEDAPFEQLIRKICQLTAATLKSPRAGVWLAEEGTPVFRNIFQTERSADDYCEKKPLLLNRDSKFIHHLEQVRVLALANLSTPGASTSFLSPDYLQQNHTATLLCAAFIKDNCLAGFLLVENTENISWHEDQYHFAREVANYLHMLVLNEHRKKIQTDLAQQEQQFRLLFFDSPLAMIAFDRESFQFIAVNHTATEVFGYSLNELLQKGIYDLIPIQQVMDIHKLVSGDRDADENGNYYVLESRMQKHDGTLVDVEIHSHTINLSARPCILMVIHDITEKKQIEGSLRRTQKMEAVGQLVGGIAHDFNNITNIIRGHTELLEIKLEENPKITKHINAINKAAMRTTSLTHKLMQFSRQQQINSESCHIDEIIRELLELITKSLTRNIEVSLKLSDELWPVVIDRGDFEDVMINLAINARDAMAGHGTLTICGSNVSLDSSNPLIDRDRKPGDYVCLSIADTGSGIPKEIQDRIFEPFFTTKEKGKGTGLGLSMVYGFTKRCGGFLELKSSEGSGTTFYLWLPKSNLNATQKGAAPQQHSDFHIPKGYKALVVDDEEDIRSSLSEILENIGFSVKQAESAQAAQHTFEEEQGEFSLVLSDIVMPGNESGVDLAKWVKQRSPDTKVILASGYSESIHIDDARRFSCELLKKPFGRHDLLNILAHWQWPSKE